MFPLLAALLLSHALSGCGGSTDDIPPAQQAYWQWIESINRNPDLAFETGSKLLSEHAGIQRLYLRLAVICRDTDRREACRELFSHVTPPDSLTRLYRTAARIQLMEKGEKANERWQSLSRAPLLDPNLGRLVVDAALHKGSAPWLNDIQDTWMHQASVDSISLGALFGLGYAAVRRADWQTAEPLLKRTIARAPDNSEAYRELGRLYFITGKTKAFEKTLHGGIRAAHQQHDAQTELILRGNLGWGLLQHNGNLATAQQMFQTALDQSRKLADGESEGFNLYRLSSVYIRRHKYREALNILPRAAELYAKFKPRQEAEVQVLRGIALNRLFRFSEAEEVLRLATVDAAGHHNVNAQLQTLVALARLRLQMGRYRAARQSGMEVLRLSKRFSTVDAEITARLLLGDVESRQGNFEAAITQYEHGQSLAQKLNIPAREHEFYERLGIAAFNINNTPRAKAYFEALLSQERDTTDSLGLARSYMHLGSIYSQFKNYRQAAVFFQDADSYLRASHDIDLNISLLLQEGWNAIGAESYAVSEAYLEKADSLVTLAQSGSRYVYRLEIPFGQLYLNQGRYNDALDHLERAAKSTTVLNRPGMFWFVWHAMAMAHWQLGDLEKAEGYFRKALAVTETLRTNLHSRINRAVFVQNKVQVYQDFAVFLDEQGRTDEAFQFVEQARSRSLADLLYTTQQEREARKGDAATQVIEAERRRRAISVALTESAPDANDVPGVYRRRDLETAYREADSLYQTNLDLLPGNSSFGALLTMRPISAEEARKILNPDEAMLMYSLRNRSLPGAPEELTAYVITHDSLHTVALSVQRVLLDETIHFFRDQIADPQRRAPWQPTSRRLYNQLVAPLLPYLPPSVNHLHIVPEGTLYYLPFAALQDSVGNFLVERFTISESPSASVLKIFREHNPGHWHSILVVADPEDVLPGTRREARSIAELPAIQSRLLLGKEANLQKFNQLAGQFDILHIATHGTFAQRAPWASHLALHNSVLNVADIGRLSLNTYLVTLSACETALSGGLLSDVPAGDEWVGLNQAFLAAGTPTVMASLWPIDDGVSGDFIQGFYSELNKRPGKARALADIQRRFLLNPSTRHPFFWAPFTVFGDPL